MAYDREKTQVQEVGVTGASDLSVAALMEIVTDLGIDPHHAKVDAGLFTVYLRPGCPNPFCNGYGDVDVSRQKNGGAIALGACQVGPHARR